VGSQEQTLAAGRARRVPDGLHQQRAGPVPVLRRFDEQRIHLTAGGVQYPIAEQTAVFLGDDPAARSSVFLDMDVDGLTVRLTAIMPSTCRHVIFSARINRIDLHRWRSEHGDDFLPGLRRRCA
jgi:hypothetical protein